MRGKGVGDCWRATINFVPEIAMRRKYNVRERLYPDVRRVRSGGWKRCLVLCKVCPSGKSVISVKSVLRKYSASLVGQISATSLPRPFPARGAVARRHERGRGCGGRGSVGARVFAGRVSRERYLRAGRTAPKRTAKPCGPDTRCWCQAVGDEFDPTGSVSPSSRQRR
jgi:hypothetical protein